MLQIGRLQHDKEGFTLVEIIFVIVIMALMMAITVPSFVGMFSSIGNVRDSQKIFNLLEKARAEAIIKSKPVEITFYTTGQCTFKLGVSSEGQIFEYHDLRATILLDFQDQIVQTFYPNGRAEQEKLVFKTPEEQYLVYSFHTVTGKIEMERRRTL